MKNLLPYDDSDEFDVDEPEEFEESGSDWDPEEEEAGKKRKGKTKTTSPKKSFPVRKKKIKKELEEERNSEKELTGRLQKDVNKVISPNVAVKAFTNGSFVILKSDLQSNNNPPLWKIDGKALLQKYIPFDQDGRILYKSTSTYSGWTQSNQENYIPAPVTYIQQGKKEIIVEFNKDKVALNHEENKKENDNKNISTTPVPVSV